MELKNLTDLAEKLKSIGEDTEIGFDMHHGYASRHASKNLCGSACCIGGWVQLCNPNTQKMILAHAVQTIARGVGLDELDALCYPLEESPAWKATPQQAARAVEILRDTGHKIIMYEMDGEWANVNARYFALSKVYRVKEGELK